MGADVNIAIGLKRRPTHRQVEKIIDEYVSGSRIHGDIVLADVEFFDENEMEVYSKYEEMYEVYSCARYYGEGYERGNFDLISDSINLLRSLFEEFDPEIYYYSDYCYLSDTSVFTKEDQRELMEYYNRFGNRPYRN